MLNSHEHILDCQNYGTCSTPLYTGRCSEYCFKRRAKADSNPNIAYWEHRVKHNDYLWVECSSCGFRVENYKAVILAGSDTKFSDVKYRFCPICGKEMRVH